MRNLLNNIRSYVLIAGATAGLPLLSQCSGASANLAERSEYLQRRELVSMLNPARSYGENPEDVTRNINYVDANKAMRQKSAEFGFSAAIGLIGLAGTTGGIAIRRRLNELLR